MCGIAGYLCFDPQRPVDFDLLSRMTGALAHRGPDAEGFHRDGPVGLGHRRLSIIDLAGGAQPMANEDGTVWIAFNGEIFNYQDLRRELEAAGHVFKTRSDTETIVHLYEQYGVECAARLVGQFAFAIWDAHRRRLYLARDQIGIKPLFYTEDAARLAFASEIKALLEDESVDRTLDREALLDYLSYRYIPAPRTVYQQVRKLPAGHWLLCEKGKSRIQRYWDLPLRGPGPGTEEQCARKLDLLLRETVKSQLMSDVPLGAFLSGGIDSSIVVGLMTQLMDRPVKTFTIGFREADFSELPHARAVAAKHRTEHHELIVEPESIDLLPRLLGQFDEPFADPSALPTYHVSKLAREHVTVAISGDGGDEGFAGYTRYLWGLKYAKLDRLPPRLRQGLFGALAGILPAGRYRTAARRFAMHPGERYAELLGYAGGPEHRSLLSPDLAALAARRGDYGCIRELYDLAADGDELLRLQYVDINSYLPDDILVKTDRMSMLCSLEVRVPLLDHRVLEFAASIPPAWRLKKSMLKKTFGHLLPPDLLNRRKAGFDVPLKHWLRGDWKAYARDLLLGQRSRERGFIDARRVEALFAAQERVEINATSRLYTLVALEEWCRQSLDARSVVAAAAPPGGGPAR
jgi:asparagine synthase (glutamine-hydrolysing)